jgi:hypothetical protein
MGLITKDSNGMCASFSKAFYIRNKESYGMWASSSKACFMEFLIDINKDSNGIVASSSKAGGLHAYNLD